jgi:lipooligosaccharide transport system permease protein
MAVAARPAAPPANPLALAASRIWRSRRLVERNILVYKHQWIIIFSGVFEPVFYLLGIGLGVGAIVETVVFGGREISYAAYVAPALLATAAMNGAVFETIFNVFFKLNFAKTYDGILATPMGITEIAVGEMLWALLRATLYAISMLVVMLAMGLVLSPWGILVVPAALFVAAAFAAAGLAGTAYLRTVNDFDIPMGLIVMPMFLFSGTFFPVEAVFPDWALVIVQATPLYHAVNLIRGLSIGVLGVGQVWDLAYLVGFFALGLWIATRQMERKLIK